MDHLLSRDTTLSLYGYGHYESAWMSRLVYLKVFHYIFRGTSQNSFENKRKAYLPFNTCGMQKR